MVILNVKNHETLYRVIFIQQGKSYEIYAKYISEEHLMGFIEIEELVFSESKSAVLVDPGEEHLRMEFKDVKRCYIPMHAITRIDEVVKEGPARIVDLNEKNTDKVSYFPGIYDTRSKGKE